MKPIQMILILSLLFIFIIIIVCVCSKKTNENFKLTFLQAKESSQFLQYIDMGDHKTMGYLQRGNGDDTVILLHNSPLNLNIWRPLYETIQRMSMAGIKIPNLVSYDLRGHGTAWMPVDPKFNDLNINNHAWSLEQYSKDCKRVYDEIIGNKSKIKVCGYGFGGKVAQKFAQDYPEIIKELIILQSATEPSPGFDEEINYLGGPNGWISRNPQVDYLTSEEQWIDKIMCEWFFLPGYKNCDAILPITDRDQGLNDLGAPQFNFVRKMYRQGSSTTTLQIDKILATSDLAKGWKDMKKDIPFKIHILAGTDDPTAPPDMMAVTYSNIYNTNRNLNVVMDIVNGRHGFSIMYPDYIAGIICADCKRLAANKIN